MRISVSYILPIEICVKFMSFSTLVYLKGNKKDKKNYRGNLVILRHKNDQQASVNYLISNNIFEDDGIYVS